MKNNIITMKMSLAVSYTNKKIKQLSYNPATALLAISPRDIKIYIQAKTCTRMFIAVIPVIDKTATVHTSFSG